MSHTVSSSLKSQFVLAAILTIGFMATAAPARAQGFISPLIGYDFGGDAKCRLITNCEDERLNIGVSIGAMGNILGFEEEIAYAPDFFGSGIGLESNVLTLMSNVMLVPKIGPVRPYVLAGIGLMKSHVELTTSSLFETSNNTFGWDMGGGVMVLFGDHFGVRGDLRYFRSFNDFEVLGITLENSQLNFGRGSAGVVLKF
jgi:opacity protein-like surface antigen